MTRRRIGILLILAIAVALGAVRDFLLVNLNYQIDFVAHGRAFSYAHSLFRGWVAGFDLQALLMLKWCLALAFSGAMLGLAIVLARLVAGDHRHARALFLGYVSFGLLALLLHGMAGPVPALEAVSVKVLHGLQYPVVLFLLWAGSMLQRPPHESGA
jgi:hypothetical protein